MLLLLFSRLFPIDIFAFFFMQLYGFVAMMIFGVSYVFIPAFSHRTLYSVKLAKWAVLAVQHWNNRVDRRVLRFC